MSDTSQNLDIKPEFTLEELLENYPDNAEEEVDWGFSVGKEEV